MLLIASGCESGDPKGRDAAISDAATDDAGLGDAGRVDAGRDSGPTDAGRPGIDANFVRPDVRVSLPMDDVLRVNHLQVEGTHNSYHQRPAAQIADWNYTHAPLDEQLEEQGVRKFELDAHWDPQVRRWRVYHVPVVDELTSCDLFLECLAVIRRWSDAHVGHHPIFVQIEPKAAYDRDTLPALMDEMEDDIRTVFPDELLITPDQVKGDAETLNEAVTTVGWPTLREARGRVLFFLNCSRDWCLQYAHDGESLDGRLIFADSRPGDPFSAVRIMNSPSDAIRDVVAAGYLVRTRAMSMPGALEGTEEQLQAELSRALATGAHMISTDVPVPRPDVASFVEMPGGSPSRCNPITAPEGCTAAALEDPAQLSPAL